MRKIVLLFAVACMTVTASYAQRYDKSGIEYQNLRGPFVTNPFGDNWFISIGGGVDAWVRPKKGADMNRGFNKVAGTYDLSVGRMFHPYYGFRLQGTYGTIKDYTGNLNGPYTRSTTMHSDGYELKFDYWDITADFLFHFSNAVGGYKEARFYNAILIAGAGFAQSRGKDYHGTKSHNNELVGKFGLLNTMRLGAAVDLNIELKTLVLRQDWAGSGSGAGLLPSATLGLTFKFNDRSFYTVDTFVENALSDVTRAHNARLSDLQRELAAAEAAAARAQADAEAARRAAAEAEAAARRNQTKLGEYDQIPVGFFQRGKSGLDEMDMSIEYAAGLIKSNPGRTFTIVGLADEETGNPQLNMDLSKKRAENVRKALIDHGVSASQLEIKALGDTVNPYRYGDLNRVVIIELK